MVDGAGGDRGKHPSGRSRRLRRGTQGVVRHLPGDPPPQSSDPNSTPFPRDPLQGRKRRPSRPLPPPASPPRLVTRSAPVPRPAPRTAPPQLPELRTRSGVKRRPKLPPKTYPSYDDQEETPADPLPLPDPPEEPPKANDTVETRIQSLEEEKEQLIRALREREEALEAAEHRFRSALSARQEAMSSANKKFSDDLDKERKRNQSLTAELQSLKGKAQDAEKRMAAELDRQVGRSRKLERDRDAHTKKLLDNMERRWRQRRDAEIGRLQKLNQEKLEAAITEARAELEAEKDTLTAEAKTWKERFDKAEAERQRIASEAEDQRRGLEDQLAAIQRSSRRQIKTLSSKAEVEKRESQSILEERARVLEQELTRIKEEQAEALARERERSVRENAKLVEENARARRDLTAARKELGRFRKGWHRVEAIKREQAEARSKLERQLSEARAEAQALRDQSQTPADAKASAELAELKAELERQRQEHIDAWTRLAHDLRNKQEREAADRASEMARLHSAGEEAREQADQWRREAEESSTRLRRLQDLAEKSGYFRRGELDSAAMATGVEEARAELTAAREAAARAEALEQRLGESLRLIAERDRELVAAQAALEDERQRADAIQATASKALAERGDQLERAAERREESASALAAAEDQAIEALRRASAAEAELAAARERGRRSIEALRGLTVFLEQRVNHQDGAEQPSDEERLLAFEALAESFAEAQLGSLVRRLREENQSLKARMRAFEEGGELFEAEDAALEAAQAENDGEELFADRLLHWICLRESREAPWTRLTSTHPMSPLRHQVEHGLWNQETMAALCRRLEEVLGEVSLEGDAAQGGPRAIAQLAELHQRVRALASSASDSPQASAALEELAELIVQEETALRRLETGRVELLTGADPRSLPPADLAKLAALAIADRRVHDEITRLTAAIEAIAAAL